MVSEKIHESRERMTLPPALNAPSRALDAEDLLDAYPGNVAVLDRAGVIVAVNAAWRDFANANGATDPAAFVGRSYFEACPETPNADESATSALEGLRGVLSGSLPAFARDYDCSAPEEARWFRMSVRPLRSGGAVCSHENISDLWLEPASVTRRVRGLTTAMNLIPGMVVYWDRDLHCQYANNAYLASFGLTQTDVAGLRLKDLARGAILQRNSERIGAVLRGEEQRFEHRHSDEMGRQHVLRVRYVPDVVDGEVLGFQALITDETIAAGAAAREHLHSVVMESLREGVSLTDVVNQTIIYANPAFEEMFGYGRGELVGQSVSNLNAGSDEARLSAVRTIIGALSRHGRWEGDVWNRRRDGTAFWSHADVSSLDHPDFGPVWISLQQDVTEKRRLDEELRASLAEKGALLHEVHHRVKNNLQIVSSLLRLEGRRMPDAAARRTLEEMQGRIRAMALLHEALYKTGQFATVDLGAYVREIAAHIARTLTATQALRLTFDTAAVPVSVEQAIPCGLLANELITNAFKHAFAALRPGQVHVIVAVDSDGEVLLGVEDDGKGLPEGFSLETPGTLGLQLSSDLARQLGGVLKPGASELGPTGARFEVRFHPRGHETLHPGRPG